MRYHLHTPPKELDCHLLPVLKGDAFEWHQTLPEYSETPLHALPHFSEALPYGKVYVKDEGGRFGQKSFKVLGASWAMHRLIQRNRMPTIYCTATDGNHGAALAWAAARFGQVSQVYLPRGTVKERVDYLKSMGARVEVLDQDYDATVCHAARFAEATGSVLVQDTAWDAYEEIPLMIAEGYTTVVKEAKAQWKEDRLPQLAILQVGVGTWAMAAAMELKAWNPQMKILCVEPEEADGLQESFRQNALSKTRGSQQTLLAGLNCGTPSVHAFPVLHQLIDGLLAIEDKLAVEAIRKLNFPSGDDPRIASGESGAAGLAAVLALQHQAELRSHLGLQADSPVLVFNTEGITNRKLFEQIVSSQS